MSTPWPQLPPGLAPPVDDVRGRFEGIRADIREAVAGYPKITLPAPPPDDLNFIRPETASAAGMTLAVGWSNYGGGYQNVSYQQVGTRVFLRGLLTNATAVPASGSGSVNNVAFLPIGVRPSAIETFSVVGGGPVAIGLLNILTDGTCQLSGIALPAGGYVSISGVTFSTIAL